VQGSFPHWQGQRQSQRKPQWGEGPGAIEKDLLLLAPAAAWGEELCLCISSGHWRWCGLSDLPCPSRRGEQGSALCKPGPDCFHCTVESEFAVISVQSDKAECKPALELLEGKLKRTHRAGRVRVWVGICYGSPVIACAFVFRMNTSAAGIACWDLGAWPYKDT